jgi:MFS family permease
MTQYVLPYASAPLHERTPSGSYVLLALLCAAAAIAYVQRSGIAMAAESMQRELSLDKIKFGAVMAAWSAGYAIAQIPSGWLADRWGTRRALTLFALTWSVATGCVATAAGYHSLLVLWTLMGAAQAGIFPCCTRAIRQAFPMARRASATGLLGSCMGIGGALGPWLTGMLLIVITWRWVFALYALPGIMWAILFYWWLNERDRLRRDGFVGSAARTVISEASESVRSADPARMPPDESSTNLPPVWWIILTSTSMWLLCAQQFLRAAAMIFFATWFPTYLRESRGASLVGAGNLTMLVGAGIVVGGLLGGFASDLVLSITASPRLSRQGIAVAGMISCAALILLACFIPNTTAAVSIISAAAFCATFGGVSGYVVAMDFGGKRVATVFSIMNTCGSAGAAVFPLVIGWIVERTKSWNLVMLVFAGIFVVDAVCWAILNPKKPLFEEE